MKLWIFVYALLITVCCKVDAAIIYAVASESGLSLRQKPTTNAKRLAILTPGMEVLLIESTSKSIEITDSKTGKKVSTNWIKIETPSNQVGYVVDFFSDQETVIRI